MKHPKLSLINIILRSKFSTGCFKSKENNFFVTTPIFYVNASPHIGHVYSAVIADAENRFQKLIGSNTFFSTGTDEHGTKIQLAAEKHGMVLPKYCKEISRQYSNLFRLCDIKYTDFIRTTDANHRIAVHNFWDCLKSRGHIYQGTYSGWYCVQDETFLTDAQLIDGPNNTKLSAESGHAVEWTEEDNFMFKLSSFRDDLLYWLKDERVVKPALFHRRLVSWLSDESIVRDLSISRPSARVPWGIPVPDCSGHTVYVWLDALVNYLTVCGYPDSTFNQRWPPDLQVVGKDILKFHGVYWPAFLIAAGLEPPRSILCHSHWTVDGEKMSKSRGNVIDPFDRVDRYTSSGLRYFLLREGTAHSDGNYSDEKVCRILNSELADTLGNLLSRCSGTIVNPRQHFPQYCQQFAEYKSTEIKTLIKSLEMLPGLCLTHYNDCDFYKVVDCIMTTLHCANKFFETEKPWVLAKKNPERLDYVLYWTMEALRVCGILLQPIVPALTDKMLDHLGVPIAERNWADCEVFKGGNSTIDNSQVILYSKVLHKDIVRQDCKA